MSSDFPIRLRLAKELATNRHVFDKRQTYQGLPYTHHLKSVADWAITYGVRLELAEDEQEDLIIAAWLHDLLEDTATKRKEIDEAFGVRVAELVWAVTNEPGPNRASRHAVTYPKIRALPLAVLLKLCDRMANVQAGGSLVFMYNKEHEDFKRSLYTPGQWDMVWRDYEAELADHVERYTRATVRN